MKKWIALALALAMVLSLSACGKDKTPDQSQDPDTPGAGEMVYQTSFQEIGRFEQPFTTLLYTQDGFYLAHYEQDGRTKPVGYKDGAGLLKMYRLSGDGRLEKLDAFQPKTVENTENRPFFQCSEGILGMAETDDGFLLLEQLYVSYYDGEDENVEQYSEDYWNHYQAQWQYIIRALDRDMNTLSEATVDTSSLIDLSSGSVLPDGAGNLLTMGYKEGEDGSCVIAIAPDGSVAYTVPCGGPEDPYVYVSDLVPMPDGRIGLVANGEKRELRLLDPAEKKLGESFPLPDDGWRYFPGDENYDLYYEDASALRGCHLDTGESEKLCDWIDCDISGSDVDYAGILPDGSIRVLVNSFDDSGSDPSYALELDTLNKVPAQSVPEKEVLTLAAMYSDSELRRLVVRFNRGNAACRIRMKDYSEYNTEDDYSAGLTKLNTEILSGNVPDILVMGGLNFRQLATRGVLADLYPLLDADGELSRDSLVPQTLKGMEQGGHLYQLAPSFSIKTVMGASSVVGDAPGWTYEDYDRALASMPEGCDGLSFSATKMDVLTSCMSMEVDNFVDWGSGVCTFDGPEFISLLRFCDRFQAEFDWEKYWSANDTYEDESSRIMAGKQMLYQTELYDFMGVARNEYYFGGPGKATFIGFPMTSGAGNAISLASGYAMGANCKNKDAAWSFLRQFITEDYQMDIRYSFPTNQAAFEAQLKEAMTPVYETDENGNTVLDENGQPVKKPKDGFGFKDGSYYDIYELSQAQADQLLTLIRSIDKVSNASEVTDSGGNSSNPVVQMVREEAQAFFAGQKTAEDVAKLVQSKATLYVNEQR